MRKGHREREGERESARAPSGRVHKHGPGCFSGSLYGSDYGSTTKNPSPFIAMLTRAES